MVHTRFNRGWPRRGLAFLWSGDILTQLIDPGAVLSMRQFFSQVDDWPEELPSLDGDTMVVSGFEGTIDLLNTQDAEKWIETDLKEAMLSFQDFYQGETGLIFWVPSGRARIMMKGASEHYFWKHNPTGGDGLPMGRLLFSGAEKEIERIMDTHDPHADYDGKEWAGLYHPRIS